MTEIRIYAEDADGNRVDITEGVQVLYDAVHASMDWGSGFLSVEDVAGILNVAQAAGFLVPEQAQAQYGEYAQQVARYYSAKDRERAVQYLERYPSSWVNCAICGEMAIYHSAAKEWEHVDHNPGHEVRLWR